MDTSVHYQIRWETWLGIVKGWNYTKNKGTKYIRVLVEKRQQEKLLVKDLLDMSLILITFYKILLSDIQIGHILLIGGQIYAN